MIINKSDDTFINIFVKTSPTQTIFYSLLGTERENNTKQNAEN